MTKRVTIKLQGDQPGRLVCDDERPGTPPVGRGQTVLEALGDYCLQNGLVTPVCDPPELLSQFMVVPGATVPTRKPYKRD